jgi:hypothetical protein
MKKTLLALALVAMPVTAHAGDKVQGSGANPYTECGIGAAIFSNTGWAAATSNVIWDLGLTAITSAIASPETCNAKKVKTAALILETLPELEKDVAMGDGEYITALADTMSCSASKADIASDLRQSYGAVVSDASYSEKTEVERATDMYYAARSAANAAGCGNSL